MGESVETPIRENGDDHTGMFFTKYNVFIDFSSSIVIRFCMSVENGYTRF